jgi:hypothetical protein
MNGKKEEAGREASCDGPGERETGRLGDYDPSLGHD